LALTGKVILITGASHRIGACVAEHLHDAGANIVIHYRSSEAGANALKEKLEQKRPNSAATVQGDLLDSSHIEEFAYKAHAVWDRLDGLINNASSFYPTPVGSIDEQQWDDLIGSNVKGPLFLSQAVAPYLKQHNGAIVNMVDIHAERPLKEHPVYCIAKAGIAMMTRSLALELGPEVRVNGVAPGAILWPENEMDQATKDKIISRTFLKRSGSPDDIAKTILFLMRDADYITGQIIAVDAGRSQNA
jgi:pteridine reductase